MRLRLLQLTPPLEPKGGNVTKVDEAVEVPQGWVLLETVSVTSNHGWIVYGVLTEAEVPPTVGELIEAAIAAGENAVGIPGAVLRQALRELGYDVPEPSPIQVPDNSTVSRITDRRGPDGTEP